MKTSLSPRPSSSSPATSSSMPSVSNFNSDQDILSEDDPSRDRPNAPVANALEHDDKRPHAPVAKLLHGNEKQQQQQKTLNSDITAFPPPSQSPRNNQHSLPSSSSSPPTIISSPNITSPHIPAAPPTTPYTPFATADNTTAGPSSHNNNGKNEIFFPTVPTFSEATTSSLSAPNLNRRSASSPPLNSSSPPITSFNASPTATNNGATISTLLTHQNPFTNDPHTTHLLHQSLLQTQSNEQSRIHQLSTHESTNYTTISEYRHALARERRHSLSLALELTHYKFLSKYQSCSLYSNLEMSEEARLNKLIKNIDDMKKDMKEDKIRVVMELEREEEGIVNGLMGRLEDVRREKRMLEQRVYSGVGGFGSGDEFESMMNMMDQQQQLEQQQQGQQQQQQVPSLVGPFGRMGMEAQDTTPNAGGANDSSASSPLPIPSTPSAIDVFPCLKEDEASEEEEEEEEEDFNDDILGGRHHDAEMEEELEKMLQMKDSKK
mmetsp:Transcript_13717/g.20448  ORF Transcript_13717/g.20448 Transcript_13717/m.20448 type:complete len:492 (+) Transcript_13717:43-1518(+)